MDNLESSMTIDLLPAKYHAIVQAIGLQPFLKLSEYCGGADLYIPKKDCLMMECRDQAIHNQYNGYNAMALAQKYNLTVNRILQIYKSNSQEQQLSFSDL